MARPKKGGLRSTTVGLTEFHHLLVDYLAEKLGGIPMAEVFRTALELLLVTQTDWSREELAAFIASRNLSKKMEKQLLEELETFCAYRLRQDGTLFTMSEPHELDISSTIGK